MWTDHPEKMIIVGATDAWVLPEEVANAMLKLIEESEFTGGTILECGKDHLRRVEAFNDAGPPDPDGKRGLLATQKLQAEEAVYERLRNGSFAGGN